MRGRVILSLCDLTGNWPRFYAEAGYDVRTIDLESGQDVRLMGYPGKVHGILAAPPCTVFAASGNRWPRSDDDYRAALAVVDACLRLVAVCRPAWWALENPRGKLRRWLGPPPYGVRPMPLRRQLHQKNPHLGGVLRTDPRLHVCLDRER